MNLRAQAICVWCGVLSIAVFFVGFWPLAHFFPPLSPDLEPNQVADFYRQHSVGIRAGAILTQFSVGLLLPFYGIISYKMKRMEGEFGPMSIAQLALGIIAIVPFIPASVAMVVATYRPEREVLDILMASDFLWTMFFMTASPAMFQYFAIAYAILHDRNERPVFPRWVGYFTIWSTLLAAPGSLIVFFYKGPFAWSGVFGYYIPATLFGAWTLIMAWLLLKDIARQKAEASG